MLFIPNSPFILGLDISRMYSSMITWGLPWATILSNRWFSNLTGFKLNQDDFGGRALILDTQTQKYSRLYFCSNMWLKTSLICKLWKLNLKIFWYLLNEGRGSQQKLGHFFFRISIPTQRDACYSHFVNEI